MYYYGDYDAVIHYQKRLVGTHRPSQKTIVNINLKNEIRYLNTIYIDDTHLLGVTLDYLVYIDFISGEIKMSTRKDVYEIDRAKASIDITSDGKNVTIESAANSRHVYDGDTLKCSNVSKDHNVNYDQSDIGIYVILAIVSYLAYYMLKAVI